MEAWLGNRRSLLRLAAAYFADIVGAPLFAQPCSVIDEIGRQCPNGSVTSEVCRYTVNATVTLAGIPLFSKKNAGGAFISIEESTCPECRITALQFAAGSWPERLKGFNRFGMTQEIVREQAGAVAESAYLSFMSSSPEKNLTEAREAFVPQDVVPLNIAVGRSSAYGCSAEVQHDNVPGTYSWRDCQEIVDRLRAQASLSAQPISASTGALPTFLFAVRRATVSGNISTLRYTHNGKIYCLKTRSERAPRTGHIAVTGRISSEGGETDFNLWLPANDRLGLPSRIQWRARSFLLLTLEVDETSKTPVLRSLLKREQA